MRRTGLSLLLMLLCSDAGAAERRYLELSTPQFTLVSAASEKETRRIALRIGMFRAAVELALGVSLPQAIQTRIYALSDRDWKQYAQPRPGLSGYFLSHPASSDLMFDVDANTGAYELIFHEYVHHILRTSWAGEVPPFVDEGLAEVFSTARFHEGAVRLEPRSDYVRYLRRHDWPPFERLINVKRDDPEYVEHNLAPAFYAQAWATMYYAMAVNRAAGARVMAYLRDLHDGSSSLSAAERFMGSSAADANREISAFIRRRERLPVAQIAIEGAASGNSTLRTLDHSQSTLAIAELMLRFGNRHHRALELLDQVRRREPENLRVQIGAAWAHLQASNWEQASALLDAAASAEEVHSAAVAVSLGRGLYQLVAATTKTESPGPEQRGRLLRARALFDTALGDKRTRIEAISGYVLASLALGQTDDSLIVMAQLGYRVAPRSSDLAVALAILHELNGKKDAAQAYWQDAARNTQTGPLRARIMNALELAEGDSPQPTP